MSPQCTPTQLYFHALGRRDVIARFDGGRITSDVGGTLLREMDLRLGLLDCPPPGLPARSGRYYVADSFRSQRIKPFEGRRKRVKGAESTEKQ